MSCEEFIAEAQRLVAIKQLQLQMQHLQDDMRTKTTCSLAGDKQIE